MRILLTAIFKDDSEYTLAKRMLDSFMPHVQGLAVAITGISGKHTKLDKLIKKHKGKIVYTTPTSHPEIYAKEGDKWFFANFAEARNASFALAEEMHEKEPYDYFIWADVDDVLVQGERLEKVAQIGINNKLDCIFVNYWYSCQVVDNKITEIAIEHLRERFLKPGIFKWISRLHEVAVPKDGHYTPRQSKYEEEGEQLVWAHLPSTERVDENLRRNSQILELQIKEEERKDPRTLFYLAKTYIDIAKIDDKKELLQLAVGLLEEYREKSGWAEERGNSWEYSGNVYSFLGDHRKAIDCYHNAIIESPFHHLPYLFLAREYAALQLHETSNHWLDVALRMDPPKSRTTIGNPLEVKVVAAGLKYNDAMRRNDIEEAIHWMKVRNELIKDDDGMLDVLLEAKGLNDAAKNVFQYAKWLKDNGHEDKIPPLLDAISPDMKNEAFVQFISNEIKTPEVWDDKSIVYFCASQFASWNPSKDEGLGGSESAVKELSKQWVAKGYKVTVYANVEAEGTYDGVVYKHWSLFNAKDTFNILILWRNVGAVDMNFKARKIFVDLHDVVSNLEFTPERIDKISKVFVKSEYHRKMIPSVPDDKVQIISNGI